MNILLIGSPGSGKGTQSQFLISKKDFQHISTGDIFRKNLTNKTELGLLAQKYMDAGDLVPDELTVRMVEEALKGFSKDTSLIFDGFPRNLEQAQALDEILNKRNQGLDLVVYLQVCDSKIVERLGGRLYAPQSGCIYHAKYKPPKVAGICDKTGEALVSRKDDKKELVLQRLKVFWESTHPILEHYKKQDLLKEIDGEQTPEKIFSQILLLFC